MSTISTLGMTPARSTAERVRTLPLSVFERDFLLSIRKLGQRPVTLADLVSLDCVTARGGTRRQQIKRVHNAIERVNEKLSCFSSLVAETDGFGQHMTPHRWQLLCDRIHGDLTNKRRRAATRLQDRITETLAEYDGVPLTTYDLAEEIGMSGPNGPTSHHRRLIAAACRRGGVLGQKVSRADGGYERHYRAGGPQ